MRGGELSERERGYVLGALDHGASTRTAAASLNCSQSCVKDTTKRFTITHKTASRPRIGRPPVLTRREHQLLARIVKKHLKIQFVPLMKEAGY